MTPTLLSLTGLLVAGPALAAPTTSFNGTLDTAHADASGHYLIDTADVTGDGRADLVSIHSNGNAYVWPGKADGSFGGAVSSFSGTMDMANLDGRGHHILGLADVNGDGRADLVSSHDNGNAYVWPGEADGRFGAAQSSFSGTLDMANHDGSGHYMIGAADVTGDGLADLISAHENGNAYVWPGRSNATFGAAVASFSGTLDIANLDDSGHYMLDISDVNGDGMADLVSAHTNGTVYVWPGQTDGRFSQARSSFAGTLDFSNLDGSGHYMVGIADTNGDGLGDLVSSHPNGNVYVWLGQTDATFGNASPMFNGGLDAANLDNSGHFIVGLGDVTGDSNADLTTAHTDGNAYVFGLYGGLYTAPTDPIEEIVRADTDDGFFVSGTLGFGQSSSDTFEVVHLESSTDDDTRANSEWVEVLVRLLLAAAENASPEVIQLNGAYTGTLRAADGSSSAPATLQIFQAGRDVTGSLWVNDNTLELDGGFWCPTVTAPASRLRFDGAGSPTEAYGNTVETVGIAGISYDLDIAFDIEMDADLEWATLTIDVETPALCDDILLTGRFHRFSVDPTP